MANASNASPQNASCSFEQSCPGKEVGSAARQHPTPVLSILTTHHKQFHPEWAKRTVLLPGWFEEYGRTNNSYWRSLRWSWRLFRESRHFDAVVTGAEHIGQMFALMQSLFRTKSSRRVHVMIDFPWAVSPDRQMLFLKRIQMRITIRAIDEIFALASPEEAERFSEALGVPREKFRFVRYHYWPIFRNRRFPKETNFFRWHLQGLSNPGPGSRRYAIPHNHLHAETSYFRGMEIPSNVEVMGVSPSRFDELMAGARAVVVALPEHEIHTGGHTVIANAMKFGKPLIVLGSDEYRSYLEPGKTGLLLGRAIVNRCVPPLTMFLPMQSLPAPSLQRAPSGSGIFARNIF